MEFITEREEIFKAMQMTHSISDRRGSLQVLGNVLIKTINSEDITFTTTDLKISMTVKIKGKILEEGGITVSANKLFEIVKGLSGKEIRIKREDQNWIKIDCEKSEYKLVGISERDFPKTLETEGIVCEEISGNILKEMIEKIFISISQDETRQHLASALLEIENEKAIMVTTDGHRLSKIERKISISKRDEDAVLIPRKGLIEIKKILDGTNDCKIAIENKFIIIKSGNICMATKLNEGQFPPYNQVIPKDNEKKILINREIFVEALKRISIIASEKTYGIKISIKNEKMIIETENPDFGNAKEIIDIKYKGENVTIGFNSKYFIELISQMKENEILMEIGGELDPALIKENDQYIGVLMPMRL
jgi:DNA polymerase III subunit beta